MILYFYAKTFQDAYFQKSILKKLFKIQDKKVKKKRKSNEIKIDGIGDENDDNLFTKLKNSISTRKPLSLSYFMILFNAKFLCCLSRKTRTRFRNIVKNGKDKLGKELDIVHLVHSLRQVKMMSFLLLSKH